MICNVLSLIRTIFDIILLRKGPEALPAAPVIFVIAVALWLLSSVGAWMAVDNYTGRTFLVGLLISAVGFIIYALLINAAGKADRIRQSLSAIIHQFRRLVRGSGIAALPRKGAYQRNYHHHVAVVRAGGRTYYRACNRPALVCRAGCCVNGIYRATVSAGVARTGH